LIRTLVGPPQRPLPAIVLWLNNTAVDIAWTLPFDNGTAITSHVVRVQSVNNTYTTIAFEANYTVAAMFGPVHFITGLQPNETYSIRIAAVNRAGASDFSAPIFVTTFAGLPIASVPTVIPDSSSSALITWKPAYRNGSDVLRYEVEMALLTPHPSAGLFANYLEQAKLKADSDAIPDWSVGNGRVSDSAFQTQCVIDALPQGSLGTPAASLTCHVDNLLPNATYVARVRALNRVGWGPFSNAEDVGATLSSLRNASVRASTKDVAFSTMPGLPTSPTNIGSRNTTSTQLHLEWTATYGRGSETVSYAVETAMGDSSHYSPGDDELLDSPRTCPQRPVPQPLLHWYGQATTRITS